MDAVDDLDKAALNVVRAASGAIKRVSAKLAARPDADKLEKDANDLNDIAASLDALAPDETASTVSNQ